MHVVNFPSCWSTPNCKVLLAKSGSAAPASWCSSQEPIITVKRGMQAQNIRPQGYCFLENNFFKLLFWGIIFLSEVQSMDWLQIWKQFLYTVVFSGVSVVVCESWVHASLWVDLIVVGQCSCWWPLPTGDSGGKRLPGSTVGRMCWGQA